MLRIVTMTLFITLILSLLTDVDARGRVKRTGNKLRLVYPKAHITPTIPKPKIAKKLTSYNPNKGNSLLGVAGATLGVISYALFNPKQNTSSSE